MKALDYILANYQQEKYQENLDGKGLSFNEGKIIDASFVEVPRQSNTPVRRIQICANQQIPAAAYCLYGIAVS